MIASTRAANRLFGAGVPRPAASAVGSLSGAAAISLSGAAAATQSLSGAAAGTSSLPRAAAVIPDDGGHSLGGGPTRQPGTFIFITLV